MHLQNWLTWYKSIYTLKCYLDTTVESRLQKSWFLQSANWRKTLVILSNCSAVGFMDNIMYGQYFADPCTCSFIWIRKILSMHDIVHEGAEPLLLKLSNLAAVGFMDNIMYGQYFMDPRKCEHLPQCSCLATTLVASSRAQPQGTESGNSPPASPAVQFSSL